MKIFLRGRCRIWAGVLAAFAAGTFLCAQGEQAAAQRAAIDAVYPVMLSAVDEGNFGEARKLCEQVIAWEPANPVHRYNLACIEARVGGARRSRALAALEQAVQLGFNDANALQTDPDLAAIRAEPKFSELVQLVAQRSAPAAVAANDDDGEKKEMATLPARPPENAPASVPAAPRQAATKRPVDLNAAAKVEKPARASFKSGVPIGLYFMTRYWAFTRSLEKAAWYFAPDGTVYEDLEHGFSKADLAAHAGRKGTCRLEGDKLEVTWAGGKKTSSELERSESGTGFAWDMGIFTAVQAFGDPADVAGVYEGGESISVGGNAAAVSKRLELRADGTFTWSGVSFVGTTTESSRISAGSSGGDATGTWRLASYSLLLADEAGNLLRRIAFPYDDEKTPIKPDRLFFGGMMYKKQQ